MCLLIYNILSFLLQNSTYYPHLGLTRVDLDWFQTLGFFTVEKKVLLTVHHETPQTEEELIGSQSVTMS